MSILGNKCLETRNVGLSRANRSCALGIVELVKDFRHLLETVDR
jgi:hypothetical protein